MKSSNKWMIVCLLGALVLVLIVPRIGLPVAWTSALITLLMIGCCVIPILMMKFTGHSEKGKGCCSHKKEPKTPNSDSTKNKTAVEKTSCH